MQPILVDRATNSIFLRLYLKLRYNEPIEAVGWQWNHYFMTCLNSLRNNNITLIWKLSFNGDCLTRRYYWWLPWGEDSLTITRVVCATMVAKIPWFASKIAIYARVWTAYLCTSQSQPRYASWIAPCEQSLNHNKPCNLKRHISFFSTVIEKKSKGLKLIEPHSSTDLQSDLNYSFNLDNAYWWPHSLFPIQACHVIKIYCFTDFA